MKNVNLLVFITQLGLSVAVPLGGFIMLALWLQREFTLGSWIVAVGVVLGVFCAAEGLLGTIRAMMRLSEDKGKEPPAVSFNEHD